MIKPPQSVLQSFIEQFYECRRKQWVGLHAYWGESKQSFDTTQLPTYFPCWLFSLQGFMKCATNAMSVTNIFSYKDLQTYSVKSWRISNSYTVKKRVKRKNEKHKSILAGNISKYVPTVQKSLTILNSMFHSKLPPHSQETLISNDLLSCETSFNYFESFPI